MYPEKITQSFAVKLQQLMAGKILNASEFCNKRLLNRLVDDHALSRRITGRTRSSYCCTDPVALNNYLRLHLGIHDLDAYIALLDQEQRDGEDSLQAASSTKTLRQKGLQGFFIKAFSTELKMDEVILNALPDGVDYFVSRPEALTLSASALVVGVENPECFVKADRLLHLFPQKELVFVLRYHSHSPVRWLETIKNRYVHFGDFDPAGIAMYFNEYVQRLGESRCRFFVPRGIEQLIEKYGVPELFDRQVHLLPTKNKMKQSDLCELMDILCRLGRGLEQEQLLRSFPLEMNKEERRLSDVSRNAFTKIA